MRVSGRSVIHNVLDQPREVDGSAVHESALVKTSQKEEFFNESAHLIPGDSDAVDSLVALLAIPQLALAPQLGDAEDDRDGGAKLVRRVRYELAKLSFERELLVEHHVERLRQLARLCPSSHHRYSTRPVTRGDGVGHLRDLGNWAQTKSGNPEACSGDNRKDHEPREKESESKETHRRVNLSE
jgi:hypothetical protein